MSARPDSRSARDLPAPNPYQSEQAMRRNERTNQLTPSVTDRDHVHGPDDAPLTLVRYGDYACPSTRTSLPAVHAVQQQHGDQLRFVFRNFRLTEIHPHALQAALGSGGGRCPRPLLGDACVSLRPPAVAGAGGLASVCATSASTQLGSSRTWLHTPIWGGSTAM